MRKFSQIDVNSTMQKYLGDEGPCAMQTKFHWWLPLKRNDGDADLHSISDFIEWDSGPWEIKAAKFYYSVEEMKDVVVKMLPYVHVPGGFPADRRIQIHVVAPLEVAAADPLLLRNFRLIQLYFADYTFLRLIFPHGPNGEHCRSLFSSEAFKCDVFTDAHNDVIDEELASNASLDEQDDLVYTKRHIVGIRNGSTYMNPGGDGTQLSRVGFEIRKSESFEAAFHIARRIALAISTMTADGEGTVGIGHERKVDILTVQSFAQGHRMNLREGRFCHADIQRRKLQSEFGSTVANVADRVTGNRFHRLKLWRMLTLLLCSDWTKLVGVGDINPSRDDVLGALDVLVAEQDWNKFRTVAAQYAFQLSEKF